MPRLDRPGPLQSGAGSLTSRSSRSPASLGVPISLEHLSHRHSGQGPPETGPGAHRLDAHGPILKGNVVIVTGNDSQLVTHPLGD
jgi:hypothetical protein